MGVSAQYQVTIINSGAGHWVAFCTKPKVFTHADKNGRGREHIVVRLLCIERGRVIADYHALPTLA